MEQMVQAEMNYWHNSSNKNPEKEEDEFIDLHDSRFVKLMDPLKGNDCKEADLESEASGGDPSIEDVEMAETQTTSSIDERNNSPRKTQTCPMCGKIYVSRGYFLRHLAVMHQKSPAKTPRISCHICSASFYNARTLNNHILKHLNETTEKKESEKTEKTLFKCKFEGCKKVLKSLTALKSHQKWHSNERPFVCWCQKSFKSAGHLNRHQSKTFH